MVQNEYTYALGNNYTYIAPFINPKISDLMLVCHDRILTVKRSMISYFKDFWRIFRFSRSVRPWNKESTAQAIYERY